MIKSVLIYFAVALGQPLHTEPVVFDDQAACEAALEELRGISKPVVTPQLYGQEPALSIVGRCLPLGSEAVEAPSVPPPGLPSIQAPRK